MMGVAALDPSYGALCDPHAKYHAATTALCVSTMMGVAALDPSYGAI